jgi:DNA-directed RNA polymerase sigma subunit (sigma70/sigma32)
LARPITLNVSQQWDQRMRTNWSLSSVHGRLVLWNVINFLPNDRKSIVMKRFGISEDGETIPPTTITDLARQTSTSKQNIDQILARTKTQIDILLSFVRRGGTL